MNFLRAILASLLSLLCTLAVSSYVTLQTLETTVLDKNEVKGWIDKSGVYKNLLGTIIASNSTAQEEISASSGSIVTSDDLKSALSQTMNSDYLKQSSEKVIDSAYSWLNGDTSTISFEINTTEKKDNFTANLSSILEPQLAQLPECTSIVQFQTNNPPCLPRGTSAKQAADELATDAANSTSIFRKPVTNQTVAESSNSTAQANSPLVSSNSSANKLQNVVSNLQMWLIWLPIITVVSGGLMVALSHHRLTAAKHLAGKLTWGLGITCAIGLLIAGFGKDFSMKGYISGTNSTVMSQIVEPVIHQAAPAIGNRLALVSGLLGLVTFAIWITLRIIKKRTEKAKLLATPSDSAPLSAPAPKPKVTPPTTPASSDRTTPPTA